MNADREGRQQVFAAAAARLRRLRGWISGLLGRDSGGTQSGKRAGFLDPLVEGLVQKASHQDALLHDIVHHHAERYWETGYEDARRGQLRARFEQVALAAADLLRQEVLSVYLAKNARFELVRQTRERILQATREAFEARDLYSARLEHHFSANPRGLSKLLALSYLMVATFLIAADIPLALKLTQEGFDLDLARSPDLTIANFFYHPWPVFQENWEVFILAAGLALCSIYIKIFYDRYATTSIPPVEELVEGGTQAHTTKPARPLFAWFFHPVLWLTILTIVALGLFRYTTIESLDAFEDSLAGLPVNGVWPFSSETFRTLVTCFTFISITLLFPVIGGICLSLGLNQLHNLWALRRAARSARLARHELEEASGRVEALRESATDWQAMLSFVGGDAFPRVAADLLRGSYNHGYERGWMDTMLGSTDIVQIAARLRTYAASHGVAKCLNTPDRHPSGTVSKSSEAFQ